MFRSSRFVSLVAMACVAAASATASVCRQVAEVVRHGIDRVVCAFSVPIAPEPKPEAQEKPRVALVMAKEFVLRMAKRERPRVTPRWRMCPSA